MNIGRNLHLKQGRNNYHITIDKVIANMSANTLYLVSDSSGENYIFSVYDGLRISYSLGRYDDGLFGTKTCTIKVSLKEKIKGWLKL